MAPVVSIKDLTVILSGKTILNALNFELAQGENLAIIGPNGSGKTVLLKALLGMIPYSGAISWGAGTRIGYVPQKIEADVHLPVTFENLYDAKARLLHLGKESVRNIARTVGIPQKVLTTPIGHLSGGEFQKALIGFALLGNPTVLLLDEPTASIDRPREEQMYELLHRLQDIYHLSIVTVSHDLTFVYRYATKVLCLNQETVCFGAPSATLTPENLEKLYGHPFQYYHHVHGDHFENPHS